jgi:hypothetical protein
MKWLFSKGKSAKGSNAALLRQFIATKQTVEALPVLSPAAKAEFDHGVDLEHLYYSSKIEGTNLTSDQLKRAVYEEAR